MFLKFKFYRYELFTKWCYSWRKHIVPGKNEFSLCINLDLCIISYALLLCTPKLNSYHQHQSQTLSHIIYFILHRTSILISLWQLFSYLNHINFLSFNYLSSDRIVPFSLTLCCVTVWLNDLRFLSLTCDWLVVFWTDQSH